MCISQYKKDARAAVRKGRARLPEQDALKAAVLSMRLREKTVEWDVAKPQIKNLQIFLQFQYLLFLLEINCEYWENFEFEMFSNFAGKH